MYVTHSIHGVKHGRAVLNGKYDYRHFMGVVKSFWRMRKISPSFFDGKKLPGRATLRRPARFACGAVLKRRLPQCATVPKDSRDEASGGVLTYFDWPGMDRHSGVLCWPPPLRHPVVVRRPPWRQSSFRRATHQKQIPAPRGQTPFSHRLWRSPFLLTKGVNEILPHATTRTR